MITVFVYLVIAFVLTLLSYRLWRMPKKGNIYIKYFFWAFLLSAVGQIFGLLLVGFFYLTDQSIFLAYSNTVGWLFFYVGAAFIIQVPLILFFPKFHHKSYVSFTLVLWGIVSVIINLILDYRPYINSLGIIQWEAPASFSIAFGLPLLFVWLSATIVFLRDFVVNRFKSLKSLFIGLGFLLASVSSIFQDFGQTVFQYLFINLVMAIGFILVLIGLFMGEDR